MTSPRQGCNKYKIKDDFNEEEWKKVFLHAFQMLGFLRFNKRI
jgi:hypothetical protein